MHGYCKFIQNALDYCIASSREYNKYDDIITCLRTHDSTLHSKFRHSIAEDIAKLLYIRYGGQIKDLKLYGSTMQYEAGMFSDIDIIIKVKYPSDDLINTLKKLDKMLCKEYYRLICEEMSEYTYFLDPHIIDENPYAEAKMSKPYLEYIFRNDSVELPKPALKPA